MKNIKLLFTAAGILFFAGCSSDNASECASGSDDCDQKGTVESECQGDSCGTNTQEGESGKPQDNSQGDPQGEADSCLKLNHPETGTVCTFGRYRQLSTSEDKQPIQWQVLDVNDENGILLISKFVLDQKRFNQTSKNVTWETCTIRSWLNGLGKDDNIEGIDYSDDNFMKIAFNNDEVKYIKTVTNINPDYEFEGRIIEAGNDTVDKIFFLSRDEANQYYSRSRDRLAYGTEYLSTTRVLNNTDFCYEDDCTKSQYSSMWWLRSPGHQQYIAARICCNGGGIFSNLVESNEIGIRPVLWLKK